jgi:two-component system chemotaxis sensor kinase CheA
MAAGFSTAEQVTDISGRGVGMDVVRRNVEEELRGKIEIESALGRGSTFRIKLPLTLAIIDGMLIRIGQERVVMPTIMIEQSLRPDASMITTVQRRGEMLRVRGELCPLVQLGEHFGYCGRIDPTEALVVVASSGAQKIGIVVSELIGQQQIVIKSLGEEFKRVEGVSGAAILGDGRVGLILEPAGLLALHKRQALSGVGAPVAGQRPAPVDVESPPAETADPGDKPAEGLEANENDAAAAALEASAAPVA